MSTLKETKKYCLSFCNLLTKTSLKNIKDFFVRREFELIEGFPNTFHYKELFFSFKEVFEKDKFPYRDFYFINEYPLDEIEDIIQEIDKLFNYLLEVVDLISLCRVYDLQEEFVNLNIALHMFTNGFSKEEKSIYTSIQGDDEALAFCDIVNNYKQAETKSEILSEILIEISKRDVCREIVKKTVVKFAKANEACCQDDIEEIASAQLGEESLREVMKVAKTNQKKLTRFFSDLQNSL